MSLNMHVAASMQGKKCTKNEAIGKVMIITSDHKRVFSKYQAPTLIRVQICVGLGIKLSSIQM
jgi:hypothetical protein